MSTRIPDYRAMPSDPNDARTLIFFLTLLLNEDARNCIILKASQTEGPAELAALEHNLRLLSEPGGSGNYNGVPHYSYVAINVAIHYAFALQHVVRFARSAWESFGTQTYIPDVRLVDWCLSQRINAVMGAATSATHSLTRYSSSTLAATNRPRPE